MCLQNSSTLTVYNKSFTKLQVIEMYYTFQKLPNTEQQQQQTKKKWFQLLML